MTELLLIPIAILAYLYWQQRRDNREDFTQAQRLVVAITDEWSEDRKNLLEQLEQTRRELTQVNAAERAEWIKERREFMNRIQAPEIAVTENYEPNILQAVPFDDDEAFWESRQPENENGSG